MHRIWNDELGRAWSVDLVVPDHAEGASNPDTVLIFEQEGARDREIPVLGPLEAHFQDLDDEALQVAFDAAGTGEGLLLVDDEGTPWWVHGPELQSEPVRGDWAVRFVHGSDEITHDGPVRARPEELTEDELLELLDEGRGRVLEEMDVTGG